jgi:FKBP-type peptidyl-prolyl cis-trans isomerase SlyD
MMISDNCVVGLNYVLKDDAGALIEDSEGRPLVYLHGHRQIVPGLERALRGMTVGQTAKVKISPAEGFGEYDPLLVFEVPAERLGNEIPPVGALLEMDNPNGANYRARVIKSGQAEVTVDANHPLAGVHLVWEVEVASIRRAEADEVTHGHVHGPHGRH